MTTGYIYQDQLETDRLITRKLTPDDVPVWADFFADKEAVEFLGTFGQASTIESAKHMIDKQLERYENKRFGLQVLTEKKTKRFIGLCGLLAQDISGRTEIEVGYHIFKKYWGQGFATEAAKLFMKYAFRNNLADSIVSVIDIGNLKSQRVAEKNGLKIEKQMKWLNGEDVYIYRLDNYR